MQQEWDNLDEMIKDSFEEIEVDKYYTSDLINKLNSKGVSSRQYSDSSALCLIFAGFLMLFVFTSSVQFKLLDFKYRIETKVLGLEYSHEIDVLKDIMRGEINGKTK